MRRPTGILVGALIIALGLATGGCGKGAPPVAQTPPAQQQAPALTAAVEQPVQPEKNPPGDIPDSQAFVSFASESGHYSLEVPEGWARTVTGGSVSFVDKLDGVQVSITSASSQPTVDSVKADQAAQLAKTGRAVKIKDVKEVKLPNGTAIMIAYDSNSDPNPVTNKQVRLENDSYLFFHSGSVATLTMWAPAGADNVDQWQRMAHSFVWH